MRHSILLHNKQKKFSHNTPSNSHFYILANICGLLSTCCIWHSVLSQLDQNKEVVPFGDGIQVAWSSLALAVGIALLHSMALLTVLIMWQIRLWWWIRLLLLKTILYIHSDPIKGLRFMNCESFLDFHESIFENILKIAKSFSKPLHILVILLLKASLSTIPAIIMEWLHIRNIVAFSNQRENYARSHMF